MIKLSNLIVILCLALLLARTSSAVGAEVASPAWASLEEPMRRDSAGLAIREHPDGRKSVDLEGRFLHMSAARRGADGKLEVQCFNDFGALDEALSRAGPWSKGEDAHHAEVSDH